MTVNVRQPKGSAAAAEARAKAAAARLKKLGLRTDDTIRFPRLGTRGHNIEGRPMDVAADGSVSCTAGGKLRAIRPEYIEVRMRGPRGGTQWVPLIPKESDDD